MKTMNAEETKDWATERNKNLTEEEIAEAERNKARMDDLEKKGRIAIVRGMVEDPEVILDKMWNGFGDMIAFGDAMEGTILDGALSTQSERLNGMATFFRDRQEKFPNPANKPLFHDMSNLRDTIEATRMKVLQGNRNDLPLLREELTKLRQRVLQAWKDEEK